MIIHTSCQNLAAQHRLNDASQHSFSSYALYWLVYASMQVQGLAPALPFCEPLLVAFEANTKQYGTEQALAQFMMHATAVTERAVRPYYERAAASSLPQLFAWLLQLYGDNLRRCVVQPSAGRILQRSTVRADAPCLDKQHPVIVVDPFDAKFNCGRTVIVCAVVSIVRVCVCIFADCVLRAAE